MSDSEAATPDEVLDDPTDELAREPADEPAGQVVIGVRFREAARMYHYSAEPRSVFPGDYVVVETARGEELARVVTTPDDDQEPPRPAPRGVRPILRQATREDRDQAAAGRERSEQLLLRMREISTRDGLDLYPIAVQLNLRGDEGTGYFQAPDHVDFRPVVEELEAEHGVALHMQQAGPRDRAKLVDGYDICGLRLCCASWMTSFPKVGIRTAKDQGLSLNPDSISGTCGRLLCCLTFEHEVYREMRGTLPKLGKRVSTPAGMGKVIKQNVLQQFVTIVLDDHPQRVDVPVAEIGMSVRTEDAPNQALIDAERDAERSQALRRAAAPPPPRPAQPPAQPDRQEREGAEDEPDDSERRASSAPAPQRRTRRRRRRAVNTDTSPRPTVEQPRRDEQSAAVQPPRRRRRRRVPRQGGDGESERSE